jgi:hypothetical protein
MKRDLLRSYLRRLVLTSLATGALQGCSASCPTVPESDTTAFGFTDADVPDGGPGDDNDGGWLLRADCERLCSFYEWTKVDRCRIFNSSFYGTVAMACEGRQLDCPTLVRDPPQTYNGTGRRTDGLREAGIEVATFGDYLAQAAYLEAASVDAFLRLAAELTAHGAPAHLIRRARAAADDERRHASVMRRLARAHAAKVRPVKIDALPVRPLEEVARENAVEGCVGETYGAAVTLHQAHAAGDLRLRAAMGAISAEEAGHAELAFAVARWSEPRLARAARRRVDEARREAARTLAHSVDSDPPRAWAGAAGLLRRAMARRLVAQLTRDWWS